MAALDDLLRRAGQLPGVEAVVLIGSLASDIADTMSDVDAIVILDETAFAGSYRQRHALHAASVPACWDQPADLSSHVAAHKWIDHRGVLVEVLLGTTPALRIAEPAKVVLGDPAVLARIRRRPPIDRAEMTSTVHPIEAAYDTLKEAVRQAAR
jgi:hypothetical protein